MRKALAIILLPFALTACGGGGGSPTTTDSSPSTPTVDAVTTASNAVASQIGATAVSGNTSTAQAFDLTADIGDTWRLVLNQDGSYTIKVLSTQYGLTDTSGTYTQSVSGNFAVLTGASGSFVLTLDKRTQTVAGTVTMASKSSAVAGSGYAVPADTSKLAGDYVYIGSTHNAIDGGSPGFVGGSFRIAANGTDITLCDGGLINAGGTCDAISGSASPNQVALTLAKNDTDGLTHVKLGTDDFGILSVQAGDRGPVLVIDRFGYNTATPPVLRTGAVYAVKQQALAGNEVDGTWACVDRGVAVGTITVTGTTVQTVSAAGQSSAETFHYNNVNSGTGLTAANGFITSVADGESVSNGVLFVPLSSSLAVVERDGTQSVAVCHVQN